MNNQGQIPVAASENPDARVWPVATVMATGVFATTFVQLQGLGYLPFSHILMKDMKLDSDKAATFMSLCTLPWSLKIIAGLLVDGVPLFGSRRRGYLLLSALAASALWLAMAFVPTDYHLLPGNYRFFLALAFTMNVAIVFGSTTSGGLLVEAGQRFGASGRMSSLRMFAQNLGAALGLPVGGWLAGHALGATSAAAIAPLAFMAFCAWFLLKEPPQPRVTGASFGQRAAAIGHSIWSQIKNVLRREMFLPACLFLFIQAVPTFRSTCFYEYQTKSLNYTDAAIGLLGLAGYGTALLCSAVYAWWCRRAPLRVSLYGAIFMTALSALPYLFYAPYAPYMVRAMAIESSGYFLFYLGYLPLFDLAVRCTPKGSEALGYSLFIGVWNVGLAIGIKAGPYLYEHVFNRHMNSLIWLNAGVTMAGTLLVFLLPAKLVERREGI